MRLSALLLGPALLVNLLTFLAPVLNLASLSFNAARPGGGIGLRPRALVSAKPRVRKPRVRCARPAFEGKFQAGGGGP